MTRFIFFLCLAFIAASEPALDALHGQGLWLVIAALVVGAPAALAAHYGKLSLPWARELFGVTGVLIALAIQYNSRFGVNADVPYAVRAIFLALVFVIWAGFGRKSMTMFAPETKEERALP